MSKRLPSHHAQPRDEIVNGPIDLDERLERLTSDADRLATCLETAELTSEIASCPGWDLRKLGIHTGFIHRWATLAIETAAPPDARGIVQPADDAEGDELGAWMRAGATTLATVLAATPPDDPTWHPFPFEQRAWVWSRRQMVETAIHRWDAEVAVTGSSELDSALAVTGITEYFELGLPRVLQRETTPLPTTSLHVHCTDDTLPDGVGEWTIWSDDGGLCMTGEHHTADAALRGEASDVLLVLMGRAERSILDIVGDPGAAGAWLDLPGW